MRLYSFLFLVLLVQLLPGCRDRTSERRLEQAVIKLDRNSARIAELSRSLDGFGSRLASLEDALQELTRNSSPAGDTGQASAPDAASEGSTLESVSRQVTLLSEEWATTKEELIAAKNALEKIGQRISKPKDIAAVIYEIAGSPEQFAKGLDTLIERVSPGIEEPGNRGNFVAEIADLRDRVLNPPTQEQLYEELRGRHVEKLNGAGNESDRQAIEQEISRLDNCSEEELRKRLAQYHRERTVDQLFRIAKGYEVNKEDFFQTWTGFPEKK
jgi:chromosome segregation ATPase